MEISNTTIIVTGGSEGYGKGIAKILKNSGATVWITGRNAQKLADTAKSLGVNWLAADVTNGEDWDRLFKAAGCPDVLINNAGAGGKIAPVSEQSDEEIIRTINVNLTGTILGCRRAANLMCSRRKGIIINISSVCALYAWPEWSVYTAAKAGIAKFSHGLYTELRPYGVRVSCVTPSWGQTNFNTAANISGASENPELAEKCTSPEELGEIIRQIILQPDHLAIPDITIQPMIQDISPM